MPRQLTLIQLLPALDAGGVEHCVLEIAAGAVQRGHRSLVVAAPGRLLPVLTAAGSEHLPWPLGRKSPFALYWIGRLRRLFWDTRADIVHAHSRLPAWLAWLAWRGMDPATRPRLVTTVHGLNSVSRYSRVMTYGEAVIAVSNTAREYVLTHYPGLDAKRVQVIPGGVDPAAFPAGYQPPADWRSDWYRHYPALQGQRVLTLAGRLSRRKGHDDLIELLALLRARGLPVHGLIVGAADRRDRYRHELEQQAQQRGVAAALTFTGERRDIRAIYAVSDLVLSLSNKPESFGRTVLEALSLGVPTAGYAYGGVGEILTQLFPQGRLPRHNLPAAADLIARLLDTPRPLTVPTLYTLERTLGATFDLYHSLTD